MTRFLPYGKILDTLALNLPVLWRDLFFPLLRLLVFMSCGLLLAFFLETMHWTKFLARFSSPLARFGHLGESSGAAFSLAFFSPTSSNALLSESYQKGRISRTEVIFSCLLNSSPAFFVHLPSMAAIVLSFLGVQGLIYLGITCSAAMLRTLCTALCGRLLLPEPQQRFCREEEKNLAPAAPAGPRPPVSSTAAPHTPVLPENKSAEDFPQLAGRGFAAAFFLPLKTNWAEIRHRFQFRLRKMLLFTVPVYILFFIMQKVGCFEAVSVFLSTEFQSSFPLFLRPEAVSIMVLSLTAELGAALSAGSSLILFGGLSIQDITLALLIGNILSTPIRALRHHLPSYAGFYEPRLALRLILTSQLARALSMVFLTCLYYAYSF
jgi:hypothetical protein